eukprot:gene8296-biopygen15153
MELLTILQFARDRRPRGRDAAAPAPATPAAARRGAHVGAAALAPVAAPLRPLGDARNRRQASVNCVIVGFLPSVKLGYRRFRASPCGLPRGDARQSMPHRTISMNEYRQGCVACPVGGLLTVFFSGTPAKAVAVARRRRGGAPAGVQLSSQRWRILLMGGGGMAQKIARAHMTTSGFK